MIVFLSVIIVKCLDEGNHPEILLVRRLDQVELHIVPLPSQVLQSTIFIRLTSTSTSQVLRFYNLQSRIQIRLREKYKYTTSHERYKYITGKVQVQTGSTIYNLESTFIYEKRTSTPHHRTSTSQVLQCRIYIQRKKYKEVGNTLLYVTEIQSVNMLKIILIHQL